MYSHKKSAHQFKAGHERWGLDGSHSVLGRRQQRGQTSIRLRSRAWIQRHAATLAWRRRLIVAVVYALLPSLGCATGSHDERSNALEDRGGRSVTAMDFALLREFTRLGSGSGHASANVSPDGKYVAFILRQADLPENRYRSSWHVSAATPGGPLVNVGDAGETVLMTDTSGRVRGGIVAASPAKWSPDGRWIAYLRKQAGRTELWRSRTDGSKQEQVTHSEADIRDFFWADDGSRIYILKNQRTRAERYRLRELEARRGFMVDDRLRPKYSREPVFGPEAEVELWIHDLGNGQGRRATAEEERLLVDDGANHDLSTRIGATRGNATRERGSSHQRHDRPDLAAPATWKRGEEERVAFAVPIQPEDRSMFPTSVVSMVSSRSPEKTVQCHVDECRGIIRQLWWSHDGSEVYFMLSDINMESEGIYAWSPKGGPVRTIYKLKGIEELDRCVSGLDRLVCMYASPIQPPILVSLDPATGVVETLVDPNPEFRRIDLHFSDPERLEWTNEFGDRTFGYLLKPKNYKPGHRYPLVVLTYRASGFLLESTGHEYPAQLFAENGFMVLAFNRPYSVLMSLGEKGRYQDDFQDSRNVQASLDAAISLLDKRGLIDPARIGITGLSNGTSIAFFALIRGKYVPAAAIVSSDTATEPMGYYLTSTEARRSMLEEAAIEFSKDGPDPEFFGAIAPSRNVEKIDTPILFHLPDVELLVSMQTIVTLQYYDKPYEAYVFPNEFHLKWQPAHLYNIYRRNLQWMKFWLQNEEQGDTVDPDQFARWSRLRQQHQRGVDRTIH